MKLKKVDCGDCKKYLIDAPVGSQVYCPRCKVWVEVESKKVKVNSNEQSD